MKFIPVLDDLAEELAWCDAFDFLVNFDKVADGIITQEGRDFGDVMPASEEEAFGAPHFFFY